MATTNLKVLDVTGVPGGVVSRTVGKDGVVRMKILMKRHQLQKILEQAVKKNDNVGNHVNIRPLMRSSVSNPLERRLKEIKRLQIQRSRQVNRNCGSYWRPALQSIPEARVLSIIS